MSALPQAVRRQIEQANQIAAEYYKAQQGGTPPNGDPPPAPPNGETPPAPPVPPAAATPPAPGEPPAPPVPPTPEEWKQKYQVLQGKYNAEVPRLQNLAKTNGEDIRQLREQLTATQNLLASLSAQQAAPAPAATPPAPTRLVKDEEVKEFGADLIDVMRRVVREEHATLLPEIDRRVAPVAQRVDQVAQAAASVGQQVARSDQQSVLSMLAQAVPKWQEQNSDPGFLEWLDQVDPYSGYKRGALLSQAFKANDGPRVVAFFSGYLKEHATVTPPAPPAPPAPSPGTQRTLETFVVPGTPKTGAASTQQGSGKRVWTRAEIGQFYADVQAGRFKGTATEKKATETDIFLAQKEGRIR